MDRVEHVARLRVAAQTRTRSKREQLSAFGCGEIVCEQDQSGPGVPAAELSDLDQLGQRASVKDRHVWMVGAQDDGESPLFHVGGDDRKAWITLDQLAQSSGEEIVELSNYNGDCGSWRHLRSTLSERVLAYRQKLP
jgi:hypothetical protein